MIVGLESGMHNKDLKKSGQITGPKGGKRYAPEQQRAWYLKNAEKKKQYCKSRYKEKRESIIELAKEYRKRRPEVTLASRLKCTYGLTIDQYNTMLLLQQNKCDICGVEFNSDNRATKPHVDHCHSSGKIRGILCHQCNLDIGRIEQPDFLQKALFYIDKHK